MATGNNSTSFGGTSIPQSVLGKNILDGVGQTISFVGENVKCIAAGYTQSDLNTLQIEISRILIESQLFESKKLYNKALIVKNALDRMNCIGADLYYMYNPLVDRMKSFITYYNTTSSTQETQASIDGDNALNPDYFNS